MLTEHFTLAYTLGIHTYHSNTVSPAVLRVEKSMSRHYSCRTLAIPGKRYMIGDLCFQAWARNQDPRCDHETTYRSSIWYLTGHLNILSHNRATFSRIWRIWRDKASMNMMMMRWPNANSGSKCSRFGHAQLAFLILTFSCTLYRYLGISRWFWMPEDLEIDRVCWKHHNHRQSLAIVIIVFGGCQNSWRNQFVFESSTLGLLAVFVWSPLHIFFMPFLGQFWASTAQRNAASRDEFLRTLQFLCRLHSIAFQAPTRTGLLKLFFCMQNSSERGLFGLLLRWVVMILIPPDSKPWHPAEASPFATGGHEDL